jgi:hypothetical protein
MKTKLNSLEIARAADVCEKVKDLTAEQFAEYILECVCDSARGLAGGQFIGEHYGQWIEGIDAECLAILKDVAHPEYCDVWCQALDSEIVAEDGRRFSFHTGECGDVFAYKNSEIDMWESVTGKDFWEEYSNGN